MKIYTITAAAALVLCAGLAGSIRYAGAPVRSSAADNSPTYTVTIPTAVRLGDTAVISAEHLRLDGDDTIRVWLSGTSESDNSFRLRSGSHELRYAVTQDGKTMEIGSSVLTAAPGDAAKTAELLFTLPEERPYPGEYTGTVAFTVSAITPRKLAIPGIIYINAKNGDTTLQLNHYNPEGNPGSFRYTLTLDDTGETLWRSESLTPPGGHVDTIALTKALTTGTYAATLHIDVVSTDGQSVLNGTDMHFEIRVKEG